MTPAGVHLALGRGEAFVMGNGEFDKFLKSYSNKLTASLLFLLTKRA